MPRNIIAVREKAARVFYPASLSRHPPKSTPCTLLNQKSNSAAQSMSTRCTRAALAWPHLRHLTWDQPHFLHVPWHQSQLCKLDAQLQKTTLEILLLREKNTVSFSKSNTTLEKFQYSKHSNRHLLFGHSFCSHIPDTQVI